MRFFTFTRRESRPGSAAYARELAGCMDWAEKTGGIFIGVSDAEVGAKALRAYANQWRRRGTLTVALALLVATLGVGLPDLNSDGRVSFADFGMAMRHAVSASAD